MNDDASRLPLTNRDVSEKLTTVQKVWKCVLREGAGGWIQRLCKWKSHHQAGVLTASPPAPLPSLAPSRDHNHVGDRAPSHTGDVLDGVLRLVEELREDLRPHRQARSEGARDTTARQRAAIARREFTRATCRGEGTFARGPCK